MYTYKLTEIVLNNGTKIQPGKLTVIVGPNNSGKSRVLKEIAAVVTAQPSAKILVQDVQWTTPESLAALRSAYDIEPHQARTGGWLYRSISHFMDADSEIGRHQWPSKYESVVGDKERFAREFGSGFLQILTTDRRLSLVIENASPAREREHSNLLQEVYYGGKELEQKIKESVKIAFNKDVALDFTTLQRLMFRVGDNLSGIPADPRDALPLMQGLESLDEQGDGIRSYVGILVALLAVRRSLVLIDEPEAFLHPPQSFRIGGFIAEQSGERRQILLATHSSDVLRGILSRTQEVDILRIDRVGNRNEFRMLDTKQLRELVNDPLLSSARVLDGLFYSGAIAVEADADARFYQAVSKRLNGGLDLHFVNADNKQTVPRILRLYKEMGVRCAGIVDFDVLNDRGEFQKQLQALNLEKADYDKAVLSRERIAQVAKDESVGQKLERIKIRITELLAEIAAKEAEGANALAKQHSKDNKFLGRLERACRELSDEAKSWKQLKQHGRSELPIEVQRVFDDLWSICANQGLFINPLGELESLLTECGIPYTTDKRTWIAQALRLLLRLEVNDAQQPWRFVNAIHTYLRDCEAADVQ